MSETKCQSIRTCNWIKRWLERNFPNENFNFKYEEECK